jgi:hypothetical protein
MIHGFYHLSFFCLPLSKITEDILNVRNFHNKMKITVFQDVTPCISEELAASIFRREEWRQ